VTNRKGRNVLFGISSSKMLSYRYYICYIILNKLISVGGDRGELGQGWTGTVVTTDISLACGKSLLTYLPSWCCFVLYHF